MSVAEKISFIKSLIAVLPRIFDLLLEICALLKEVRTNA